MTVAVGARAAAAAVLVLASGTLALAGCGEADRPSVLELPSNRAYSGAPPTVPHPVNARNRQRCLSCHLEGDAVSDDGKTMAQVTPHPELENCVSCHVERKTRTNFRRTRFLGKTYGIGLRSQPQGPWSIPHPLTMRENCLGCHGSPNAPAVLRTTHPERQRCVQCHLPAHEGFPGPRTRLNVPTALGGTLPSWSL